MCWKKISSMKLTNVLIILLISSSAVLAQPFPSVEENIPYLVTFGGDGETSWGDDDFTQIFFFSIPKSHKDPVYIRVFDPGTGGEIDEAKGEFNTTTKFSVYGGTGCITNKAARSQTPSGEYKSGNLLASKTFVDEMDGEWYSFGPFNPTSGELSSNYGGYVIKFICEGVSGNDGNLYKYYLSTSPTENKKIQGGNAFTFEYTFRLNEDANEISHIYPYVDSSVISIKQSNFDYDSDGDIKITTAARLAIHLTMSGNDVWMHGEHKILQKEKETSFDIQFVKRKEDPIKRNNVTFYVTNQYGDALPFWSVPIGGVPKPTTTIKVIPK